MRIKKIKKKKNKPLKNIQSLVPKNLDLSKLKMNPFELIDGTKKKIGSFYNNLKKQREKEKQRAAKKIKFLLKKN